MNLNSTVNDLVKAHKQVQETLAPVIAALKDVSIPLDQRWAAYTALVDENILVQCDDYGDGFVGILGDNVTLYDDFNIDRHQTGSFVNMYNQIVEADADNEFLAAAQDHLAAWQERVLQSGYSEFIYD